MAEICTTTFGNVGSFCEKGDSRGVPVGLILTTKTFEFQTYVKFTTESEYTTAIKAKEMFPFPEIVEFDDNTEDAVYYTSPLGVDKFLRDGKYKFLFRTDVTLNTNKEMQKFSNANLRVFIVDSEGMIWGYSDDGTTVRGFSVSTFKVENQKIPAADKPGFVGINITLANPREWNDFGVIMKPNWILSDLNSLANVQMTVPSATATSIVVSVGAPTGEIDSDGSVKEVQIAGLDLPDFKFLKASDGSVQTPTAIKDNKDGSYDFTFSAAESGTVNLVDPSAQINTFLIESTGAASFTI